MGFHGLTPQYLSELLIHTSQTRDLCSTEAGLLTVPPTHLGSMGDGASSSFAPKLWDSLSVLKLSSKQTFFRVDFISFLYFFFLYHFLMELFS